MKRPVQMSAPGPFRAEQLRSGDPYELHRGHAIHVSPTGGQGSGANLLGGAVILSDPAVQNAGVDAGFSPEPGTLRAPDVAVLPVNPAPGWLPGVPPLAIEYAGPGQDEDRLHEKIQDLLDHGTEHVWVVRLSAIPHVEVWRPGEAPRLVRAGEELAAPGVLANSIPVEALWNHAAGEKVIHRNMLQRYGYRDLDEVREEGREEGQAQGSVAALRAAVRAAAGALDPRQEALLAGESRVEVLTTWVLAAARGQAWGG